MSNSNINPPSNLDPDQLTRLLDLELKHKRVEWERTSARARSTRVSMFAFLFFLVLAGAFAFMYLFSRVNEERSAHPPAATASEAPR